MIDDRWEIEYDENGEFEIAYCRDCQRNMYSCECDEIDEFNEIN